MNMDPSDVLPTLERAEDRLSSEADPQLWTPPDRPDGSAVPAPGVGGSPRSWILCGDPWC